MLPREKPCNIMQVRRVYDKTTVCITELNKLNLVKRVYGGSVVGSSQFSLLPQLPQKHDAHFKSDSIENKHLILLV